MAPRTADGGEPSTRTRTLKVLEVTGVSIGGSAEHMLLLSRLLDRDRFDVHIALWSGGPLDTLINESGLPVHYLDGGAPNATNTASAKAFSGGRLRFLTGFVHLVRLLRSERFDIVHTHTSVAGILGRLAAVIARTPTRVHMLHSIASNDHVEGVANKLFRLLELAADRVTTHYVAGSDAIATKFVDKGLTRAGKVSRIHYSMDIERFRSDAAGDIGAMRARLGARPDDVVVALVGRLEDQKGVEYLIDAAPAIVRECPHTRIAIVGDGSRRTQLEERAHRLGVADRITFTGWLASIGLVMSAADIMAIPSRWEAFGIVNLEAMAASTPIAGFAVEGIPEVVVNDITGLLSPAADVESFGRSVIRLIGDPVLRTKMGEAGRRRFETCFLPEFMVAQHEDLFERLALDGART